MKQTAVEWFAKQVLRARQLGFISNEKFNELLEQAKEMEKEQIVEAYNQGSEAGYELAKNDDFIEGYKTKEAEQYYNETFKSE